MTRAVATFASSPAHASTQARAGTLAHVGTPARAGTPSTRPVGLLRPRCSCGSDAGGGDPCPECERSRLQRKAVGDARVTHVPPVVRNVLQRSGQPLDNGTRAFMEQRFGHRFDAVRVHTDAEATNSACAVNAAAYTVGRDIVFDSGRYRPHSTAGRRLLAHELAHVIQQGRGGAAGSSAHSEHSLEQAAEHAADATLRGPTTIAVAGASAPRLARAPGDQTPREIAQALVKQLKTQGKPIVANIGGTGAPHEPAHAINVNPNEVAPRNDIPNFVKAKGETIGSLFEAGQVEEVVGFDLSPPVFDWEQIAQGSHAVLKPGGKFEVGFRWPDPKVAQKLMDSLKKAGFENVSNMGNAIISGTKGSGGPKPSGPIRPSGGIGGAGGPGGAAAEPVAKGAQVGLRAGAEEAGSILARTPVTSPKLIVEIEKSIGALRNEVSGSIRVAGYVRTGVMVFNAALQAFVIVTTLKDAMAFAGEGTIFGDAQRDAEKLRVNAAAVRQAAEAQWDGISLLTLTFVEDKLEESGDLERLDDLGRALDQFASSLDDPVQTLKSLSKNLRARSNAAHVLSEQLLKAAAIPQGAGTIPQAQEFMLSESLLHLSGPLGSAANDYDMALFYLSQLKNGVDAISAKASKAHWNIVLKNVVAALAEQEKQAAAKPKKAPPPPPSPAGVGKSHAAPPPHLAPVPQAVKQKQIEGAMMKPPSCPGGNCHQTIREPSLRERLGEDFFKDDPEVIRKWLEQKQ